MTARSSSYQAHGPSRLAALVAALVGAVLLGLSALKLFLALVSPLERPDVLVGRSSAGSSTLAADTSVLQTADLFTQDAGALPPRPQDEALPETTLRLVLKSATPTPNGVSGAVIQVANGQQRYFREGDEVMRGVTLTRVETWRVVITRNGRREALTLENRPEQETIEGAPASANADRAAPRNNGEIVLPDDIDDRGAAATLRQLAGPMLPVLEEQGFEGDDIPVAIDGESVPSDQVDLQVIWEDLQRAGGSVTVTVARDGRAYDIGFTLPSLRQP